MIERRNCRDGSDRLAFCVDLAVLAVGREIAGEDLPVIEDGELTCEREDVIGPPGLVERMLFADAELECEHVGDGLAPVADEFGRLEQDLLALEAAELRRVVRRDLEGLAGMFGIPGGNRPDHLVGVGIAHLDNVLGFDAPSSDAHRFLDNRLLH